MLNSNKFDKANFNALVSILIMFVGIISLMSTNCAFVLGEDEIPNKFRTTR